MTKLQTIVQEASVLSVNEKRVLAQLLLEQAARDTQAANLETKPVNGAFVRPDMDRAREFKWLKENWQAYLGQWVCLEGDQLVGSGNDPKRIFAQATAAGIQTPFMVRVQDPTILEAGGIVAV